MIELTCLYSAVVTCSSSDYGCSFVAKLSWKKMFLYGKEVYIEKCFYWKKLFTEKNINENVKNISHFRNIFLHRKCLCYK